MMETRSSHPTTYELDCYNVQALEPDRLKTVGQHVESCRQCRAYLEELQNERSDLHARLPARPFAREVRERAGRPEARAAFRLPAWGRAALLPALAASLVLLGLAFVLWWGQTSEDTVRTMGGFHVNVFVKHHDSVKQVHSPTRISEGDSVRLHLVSPLPIFVAVFFMDETGKLSWYLPSSGTNAPLEVPAGETALPASARFDASPYNERAFVVYSPESFIPEEVAWRIQDAWRRARSSDFAEGSWLDGFDNLRSILFLRK